MAVLLTETLESLKRAGKAPADVLWVGSRDGKLAMPWDDFASIARVRYDSGYGGQEIAKDLVVVGNDWWMERREYDGSEWWEVQEPPLRAPGYEAFRVVKGRGSWCSLAELNGEESDND